jgi:hypothetical protein
MTGSSAGPTRLVNSLAYNRAYIWVWVPAHGGDTASTIDINSRTWAVPWLRRLLSGISQQRSGFAPGSVHVGFVVNKVALGQVLLQAIRFPLSTSFHRASLCVNYSGINKSPFSNRSLETKSHPIDMNNNNNSTVHSHSTVLFQNLAPQLFIIFPGIYKMP